MTIGRFPRVFVLSVLVIVMGSTTEAQIAGGADRYLNSAQQSLSRTNGMISSMTPSYATPGVGSQAMAGATLQSINRTNAMMQSMLNNRATTIRGMEQQVIYRTPDNLYGVYWQTFNTRQAQIYANVGAAGGGNGRLMELQALEIQRRRAREQARSEELAHRFRQRSQPLPPHTPPAQFDTIQSSLSHAHLYNAQVTITAPSPIPQNLPRREAGENR